MDEQSDDERKLLEIIDMKLAEKAMRVANRKPAHERYVDGTWLVVEGGGDTVQRWVTQGLGRELDYNERQTVRAAVQRLVADGLLVPGAPNFRMDGMNHPFLTFSPRGLRHFCAMPLSLESESALLDALTALQAERPLAVDKGQIALLGEAQKCWRQSCYRASMVLIGVASEDLVNGMLDVLAQYPSKDTKDPSAKEWSRFAATTSFAGRLGVGISILKRLAKELIDQSKRIKPKPTWGDLWACSVESLSSIGEAVRCARNSAAHDGSAVFRRSDTGLILASMPTLLSHVDELRDFLADVPTALGSVPVPIV